MEDEKQKEDFVLHLEYQAPSIGRNLAGKALDAFLMILLGFLLLIPGLAIRDKVPGYKRNQEFQDEIRLDSKLYQEKEGEVQPLSYFLKNDNTKTQDEKSQISEESLTYFFSVYLPSQGIDNKEQDYLNDKQEKKAKDGNQLFDEKGNRILTKDDYDSEYYSFYLDYLDNQAVGYLVLIPNYHTSRQKLMMGTIVTVVLCFVASHSIFYLILPLCFSRGKKTLGMLATKTALVSVDGLSCRAGRFILHYLLELLVFIGCAAFFIPLAISITMIVVTKAHQSFPDYVTNTYLVMNDEKNIYKDISEVKISLEDQEEYSSVSKDISFKS